MKTVKLQVPMDEVVCKGLEVRARELGFDSAQAYIRVWAKAQAQRRTISFGEDDWGEPSSEAIARWEKQIQEMDAEEKAGTAKSFDNVKDFMANLANNEED